jgi:hypothetical protein
LHLRECDDLVFAWKNVLPRNRRVPILFELLSRAEVGVGSQDIRDALRAEHGWAVSQLKVQVGSRALAGEPHSGDDLPSLDMLTHMHVHAAML